jgi:isoamylase
MFRLPARRFGNRWRQVISTAEPDAPEGHRTWPARSEVPLTSRSMVLMRRSW